MQVTLTLAANQVAKANDLDVKVVIVNQTSAPVRLNTSWLAAPSLVLKVKDAAGKPVPLGPPPTPQADDGDSGRETVPAGGKLEYSYKAIFGSEPKSGTYTISFQATLGKGPKGADWAGTLASDWVTFQVK